MNPNRVQQIMKMSKASAHYMIKQSGMWRYLDSDSMDDIVQDLILHSLMYDLNRGGQGKFSWRIYRLYALQAIYRHLGWPDQYKKGQRLKYTMGKCELDVGIPDETAHLHLEPWVPIAKKRLAFHFERLTKRQQDALIDWFNEGAYPGQQLSWIRWKCNGTVTRGKIGWYDPGGRRYGQEPYSDRERKHRRRQEMMLRTRKCQRREAVE